jgi:hypothetical protein
MLKLGIWRQGKQFRKKKLLSVDIITTTNNKKKYLVSIALETP